MMPKPVGYAVVGVGDVAQKAVIPAFSRAADSARLVAVVAADRARAQVAARPHGAAAYHYDELRQCLQREDVHAAYIAGPTSTRCDYAVEAARAGVHVLCETPMAVMADECRRMIRTCQTNRVKLMVAYRLPFQPASRKALELVQAGALGAPRTFSSDVTLRIEQPDDVRLQRRLGGGTMYDLGTAAINAARQLFAAEAAQVMAMTARPARRHGGDVDESAVALIRFPEERLAHLHTSFGEERASVFTLFGEEGYVRLTDAYHDLVASTLELVRGGAREELRFEPADGLAAALAHLAECIVEDRAPEPSGVEGLQDVRIVEAIYRSARDGRPVTLPRLARVDSPPPEQDKAVGDRRQAS
ncbi:MAG TPA: Gfo/Idh/MocA family oxidoreductase [Methylomirabilota bacterium]|nr:Gfo/Idh/MocA family oxidoreductase [Methylomirabilota bacterium]